MEDPRAKDILAHFEDLKSARYSYLSNWQEIRDLVRPGTEDFTGSGSPGDTRNENIYDGTAPQALIELAAGLQSFLTSPSELWFSIDVQTPDEFRDDPEALDWLDAVTDLIYTEYSREEVNLNASLQELYLDLGAFGTAVLNQEYEDHLVFRAFPLADCYVDENHNGKIDVLFRGVMMTTRQLEQAFGAESVPVKVRENKDPTRKFQVIHAVFPRRDRIVGRLDKLNMSFASFWVLEEPQVAILKESGYRSFPYHVPRWTKLASETYGRGPAIECLPDIKMLNRMEYTNIKCAQKAVDPPLMVPDDGFLGPIKTAPGSLLYKEPGTEDIKPLEFSGEWPVAIDITNQKRDFIRRCFYSDWLRMEKERVEMTAYEVADRRDEKLRFLAPMLGRIQCELLGPMIQRSYELLLHAGRVPPAPESLQRRNILKVGYLSPAAKAQQGLKAVNMGRYIQELIPLAQVQPEIMDAVDLDDFAQELALVRGTPRKILRTPSEITGVRDGRAQQQQMAMLAQAVEPASKAIKNLADARSKGGMA